MKYDVIHENLGNLDLGHLYVTVRIEIGKTYGAEGIRQITFFVSRNIL